MGGFMVFLILIMVMGAIVGWYRAREDDSGVPAATMGQDLARAVGSLAGGKFGGLGNRSNADRAGRRQTSIAQS